MKTPQECMDRKQNCKSEGALSISRVVTEGTLGKITLLKDCLW